MRIFPGKVHSPELTGDPRLMVEASMTIDGNSLANRVPGGELLMLIQIEDGHGHVNQGHVYQGHGAGKVSVEKTIYTHRVLVARGDYRFTLAVVDSATGRHNLESSPIGVHDQFPKDPKWKRPLPDKIALGQT